MPWEPDIEECHQFPPIPGLEYPPPVVRIPPGKAEKPEELVAPLLGANQPPGMGSVLVLFIAPPAKEGPPKKVTRLDQSAVDGTCQPVGQIPLGSKTAYWLYNLPYKDMLAGSLLAKE